MYAKSLFAVLLLLTSFTAQAAQRELAPDELTPEEAFAETGAITQLPFKCYIPGNEQNIECLQVTPAGGVDIRIEVSLGAQELTVYVNGQVDNRTYEISSGRPGHSTPKGSFAVIGAEKMHYSKKYDNAPMPDSLFFTLRGHALHCGNVSKKFASHGCVRVEAEGCQRLWQLASNYGIHSMFVDIANNNPYVQVLSADNRAIYGSGKASTPKATGKPLDIVPPSVEQRNDPAPQTVVPRPRRHSVFQIFNGLY